MIFNSFWKKIFILNIVLLLVIYRLFTVLEKYIKQNTYNNSLFPTLTDDGELKLEVLLEMHSLEELDYAELDVDMLGINNRNLGTFHTDVQNSFNMIARLPDDKVKVSESGIGNPETIKLLRAAGYRGFLMGEHFMKQPNPGQALCEFLEKLKIDKQLVNSETQIQL